MFSKKSAEIRGKKKEVKRITKLARKQIGVLLKEYDKLRTDYKYQERVYTLLEDENEKELLLGYYLLMLDINEYIEEIKTDSHERISILEEEIYELKNNIIKGES